MEIIDWVYKYIKNKIKELFDNIESFLEAFWFFVKSLFFLFGRSTHHKYFKGCFLLVDGLNLLFIYGYVSSQVFLFANKKSIRLNGLKNGVGFLELKLEDIINEP